MPTIEIAGWLVGSAGHSSVESTQLDTNINENKEIDQCERNHIDEDEDYQLAASEIWRTVMKKYSLIRIILSDPTPSSARAIIYSQHTISRDNIQKGPFSGLILWINTGPTIASKKTKAQIAMQRIQRPVPVALLSVAQDRILCPPARRRHVCMAITSDQIDDDTSPTLINQPWISHANPGHKRLTLSG
jgi:hypothetical protein